MTEKRIQFNNIIQNQLPAYVREEFPLVAEFLKQYYISQEFQSSSTDLIQNIDQYLKLDTIKSNSESTTLTADVSFLDESISVLSTIGFPDSYGLLQIDDEIITYTSKTPTSFIGCIRGFSGVTSYNTENKPDELLFKSSESADHSKENSDGTTKQVINLSSLFLEEFFNKIKYQLTPGFEQREFYSGLDKYLFLKQSKDFYSTRGTDLSFKILFKVLYGEDVKIIRPQDYLIKPSDAQYNIVNELVVESISGDPYELENSTLKQIEYGDIPSGYAPITKVEKIYTKTDKSYYKLSFDAGYNRDIRVDGALYGNFSVHPKTKIIGEILDNSETISVDSTVGFPLSGELSVIYFDGSEGIISYTSKSINQFFGCQNITKTILDETDIYLNVYAEGQSNQDLNQTIKVRITSVLKDVDIVDDTYYYKKGDVGIIRTLGVDPKDVVSNNWFFNIPINSDVVSIEVSDDINKKYKLTTKSNHNLRLGDTIKIVSSDGTEKNSIVDSVISDTSVIVAGQGDIETFKKYYIKRNLTKVNSPTYDYLSSQTANIQNVYKIKERTLVASPSLPYYNNQPLVASNRSKTFSGVFQGDIFYIANHDFYTGDAIYYTPGSNSLFDEGLYFIKKVDANNVKFAKSRANIYNSIFINLENSIESFDNKIEDYDLHNKNLESQKILREINPPINDGNEYTTNPGTLGILINGVEILNYKSKDNISYGPIENIDVISGGFGYDIINPPSLIISDSVGVGATGYCAVKGSLREIRIVDPGFDYIEVPKINITGGNGSGAKAYASMKLIDHKVFFNSELKSAFVNIANDSIGFSTYHKFRNFERIVYRTEGQTAVGGITTNSSYYVSVQDPYTIKLHKTLNDSLTGINTVSLTSYGVGNHIIESYNKKSVIASINIENSGSNYENKERTISSSGISTSLGQIEIKNHDFKDGEIVQYSTNGTAIGGLVNNQKYYVTKVDEDNFKLSSISNDQNNLDFYYKIKEYIQLTSPGSGVHRFNYPQISVDIVGEVGISSISGNSFKAVVQPIFRGEITSVHLKDGGVGYGSSEILNFDREPIVSLSNGIDSQLIPVINNGRIDQVLINNPGSGYNSAPNLSILTSGKGVGAVLTPIVENGKITSVKVIESGAGYEPNNTFIVVTSAGSGALLKPELKSWTINLFAKYFNSIANDDGIIFYNSNSNYGLEYAHLYAPRKLRENIYSIDSNGKILYGKPDLIKSNNVEVSSINHSPIIGWSYDGNPIYGPYGYSKKDGGSITRMKSGYILEPDSDRPPFPEGFFVDDFKYYNIDDDSVLDQNNGRFCITPDFPNGVYAYFSTIEDSPSNNFGNYRLPSFPYFIGDKFKSLPNEFNFNRSSNQDDINLNQTKWTRNTLNYNLNEEYSSYSYVSLPNSLNQTVNVKYTSSGSVESIGIVTGGLNYKVNDNILFDDSSTSGYGFVSKVSRVKGKTINNISAASTTIYDVEILSAEGNKNSFIVQSNYPHNLVNKDLVTISGLNTSSSLSNDFYIIDIKTNTFSLSNPSGINSAPVTGIVTYIPISGNLSNSNIRENDIFLVGSEKVKVLSVDRVSSRIKVLRCVDGTVGTSHSYSDILYEIPRRFIIGAGSSVFPYYRVNKEIYFDPNESLGIGTNLTVGAGNTIVFSNPGVGITQIFIPTKAIYLPNHNLQTGDTLKYYSNNGTGISISVDGINSSVLSDQSTLYVAKINNDLIGISTVKVGVGSTGLFVGIGSTTSSSTTLYLTGIGTGVYHSFRTQYPKLSGQVSRNIVNVSTAETHGLSNNDYVFVDANAGISKTFVVSYDDYNRKVIIDPKTFSPGDVDISTNSITIQNHGFKTGQKVSYASTLPLGELINNKIYYAVVYNQNKIQLATSYYKATSFNPETIGIGSTSRGVLSSINPQLEVYRNSTVTFDVSNSTLSYLNGSSKYSAFQFNFYRDSNFTQLFDSSESTDDFEVQRIGSVGIDSYAKVTLKITDNVPKKLFYKLDPIYNNNLPVEKQEVNVDTSVFSNNQIEVLSSVYDGKHRVTSTSSTSFTYNTVKVPESTSYNSTEYDLKYETSSLTAFGGISKVDILSKGQNYYSLPDFLTVSSTYGNGSILEASSKSIGKIEKTKINDIGFDFPIDSTLRPNLIFPQILKIEPLNSLSYIGITSVGRGYLTPAKLILFDGKTKEIIPEVNLKYSLKDTEVTILTNTYRLNETEPTIIPIQNSNGVGIKSIDYNPANDNVTVTLSVGFSTANSFPFAVGDRVLIENISVGIDTTGKGYNSENYNYKLFTLTAVDENIGGIGTVTYNLGGLLSSGEFPGTFDEDNSSGRIIPEKYFPTFKIKLKTNNFFKNEKVRYSDEENSIGFVEEWNEKVKYLKVSSREIIETDRIIEGLSSKTQGLIYLSIKSDAFINTGSYSKVENGWITETGILNNNLQRIHDNFYYQNFSYSLKSKVSYNTWEDAVGSLNHTVGFKKFSDCQVESNEYCGIKTDTISRVDATADIDGFASLNCVYDFDLARENALFLGYSVASDEITFSSRILTDYYESISNRVLSIDDISGQFNSNARSDRFSVVHRFLLSDARAQKYITYVKDRRYTTQKQVMMFTLLHNDSVGYMNQYGRVESSYDLGSFDFEVDQNEGVIKFYPTKYRVNDYNITTLSYNIKDNLSGIGTTSLGGIVDLKTSNSFVSSGSTTIVGLGTTYTSAKILVEVSANNGQYQFNELTVVHDGTNVEFIDYGQLTNHSSDPYSTTGVGTYYAYLSGSNLNIDFIPSVGIAATINTIQVAIANTSVSGVGTFDIRYARFEAKSTSIASSTAPSQNVISEYTSTYDGGYFIVQVSDITNNRHQISELVSVTNSSDCYFTEFANLETYAGLGTIGAIKSGSNTQLVFTPIPNIVTEVKVYSNLLTDFDITNFNTEYNSIFESDFGIYYGTERDIKRSFELKHNGLPIFQRYFNGSDSAIVSIASSTITIPNHFFVTGEEVRYSSQNILYPEINSPIGIGSTYFGVGIGTTDKLPSTVYVIKVDNNNIKLARSAEEALRTIPKALNITSVGIGSNHSFTSNKQNAKALIAIDNVIQSPVVSTSTTSILSTDFISIEDNLYLNSTNNFFIGDLIKIDDEIMKVESVGVGTTNAVRVIRPWLGTEVENHTNGSLITKLTGNYNIVDNIINFVDAPYGNVPLGTTTNPPDERDWVGISTSSSFQGRTFMRSGITDESNEAYYKNYLYDDISSQFDGSKKTFTLKSNNSNVTDVFEDNAIILINEIFQGPGLTNNYTLDESVGITSITFVGTATSQLSDINTSNLPSGGIIVSVGSTAGFGYQPLVSAGGTATVSIAGTISSISIGNSGSGYRSQIQTLNGTKSVVVRVGVATSSVENSGIEFIGTATVSNGNIVSIAITNPGTGYTSTNPPRVIIDSPISYSDIPLIYSTSSSGIGTRATVDIVVGQGSSVIDFELKNIGYGYNVGEILTIPFGGTVGIPTVPNSTLNEFQISVQQIFTDKFAGWSVGEMQIFDNIERLFNGRRVIFPLSYLGQLTAVYAKKGSLINIQDTLFVFINDILQVPGQGYIFNGGSKIEFTEAPKPEDTCKILFYKGSGEGVDVIFQNIMETVKEGDELTLTYDSSIGQSQYLLEDPRTVVDIMSIDTVETNPYFGPGNTTDTTLKRPLIWCRQTEDKIINETEINKNRMLYEPLINPTSYLIQSVGIGTSIMYVDTLRPFFNAQNEAEISSLQFQKNVTLISQDVKVSASATAVVSIAGTISSIVVNDGGFGYDSQPLVSIQSPIGISTISSTAISSITSGIVTSISITGIVTGYSQDNPPAVLIEPPTLDMESDKVISYSGDSGIIVGFGTTTISSNNHVVLDLFIPSDSTLRMTSLTGTATTLSSLTTDDFFVIYNSNIGIGTSFITLDSLNNVIGITSDFVDNICRVTSSQVVQKEVVGVGTTYVRRVFVKVSGLGTMSSGTFYSSNYFGNYSWGKIQLKSRSKDIAFNAYTNNGTSGITSSAMVKRTSSLKYVNYIV